MQKNAAAQETMNERRAQKKALERCRMHICAAADLATFIIGISPSLNSMDREFSAERRRCWYTYLLPVPIPAFAELGLPDALQAKSKYICSIFTAFAIAVYKQ